MPENTLLNIKKKKKIIIRFKNKTSLKKYVAWAGTFVEPAC